MSNVNWDDAWGAPEDYNIVEGKEELEGFKVGHTVRFIEDGDEGGFVDDEGLVVGIAYTPGGMFGPARNELIVKIADYAEPIGVSPFNVELA